MGNRSGASRQRSNREVLREKNQTIARLRRQLRQRVTDAFPPERVIWIFGSARTGSTWLGRMLGELGALWDEPAVGALFGEFYYERFPERRGARFIMANRYRDAWMPAVRDIVLRGAEARYQGDGYLTIKEPHGSVGAPLLIEALPESRVILLARDPRDAIASDYETELPGSWWTSRRDEPFLTSDEYDFWTVRSRRYVWDFEMASEAYRAAPGPKAIVRYEDLHADAFREMRRLRDALELSSSDEALATAVEKYAWKNVPEEQKGPGRFYRSGEPGAWQRQLAPEQAAKIETEASKVLEAFYEGSIEPVSAASPAAPAKRARELSELLRLIR
jgi:hypothetical protein